MSLIAEIYGDIKQIGHYRKQASAWQKKHEPQVPKVGEMATDFSLQDTSGTHAVTLSDFKGKKPVALIFGSFT